MDEKVQITLTVAELTALLDVTEATLGADFEKFIGHPLHGADYELHVALEGTDFWKGL